MSMISGNDAYLTLGHGHDTLFHGIGFGAMRTTGTTAPATGNATNATVWQSDGPFGDPFVLDRAGRRLTGLSAITEISRIDSPTPSTPSFYPASLPPTETEEDPMWSIVYSTLNSMPSTEPPPRPPRRRPLPPSSRNVAEATTVLPSAPAPAVVSNVVSTNAVPHTRVNLTISTSVKDEDAKHETSKPSGEFQLLSPVSSISVYSQTDSRRSSATITAPALDYSAAGELKDVHNLLLKRALVGTRAVPRQI
ncbi:hypothetical protein JVU11DRAFT_5125 [Chiua virens]|nr:hypothetical protein JVU11DRAFT_5125 [Chiua virens]